MTSLETPRRRVEGLGSAHSGVQQFWRLRISGAALGILSIWFAYVALGFVGAGQVPVLAFLQHPINSVLMGSFMLLSSYHMALGLREVVEDYVHTNGTKIFLLLMIRLLGFAAAIAVVVALLRITIA
jgi:succinate dehydrogenase / fumarate reductase membrane anchor subunit